MRDSVAGTPAFMAPELFEDNTFTEKSDVYSYAVVLWEIYDRGIPWAGLKPQQILYKLIKEQRLDVPKAMPRDQFHGRAWAGPGRSRASPRGELKATPLVAPINRPWSAGSPRPATRLARQRRGGQGPHGLWPAPSGAAGRRR